MKDKVRIGILGGGGILGAHAPAFMKLQSRCTVVAVAEPDAARTEAIRRLLGSEVRIVDDYRKILEMDAVDAVDILLPHDLHMQATVEAAEAGLPVLTEKVMARNIWECDRMIEACEKAGVSLTVCHDRRYDGRWMGLKEVVDSGALGEIFSWKLDHNQDVEVAENRWIRSREKLGGGAVMSCLTHQIDALRWYGGEVERVACMTVARPERMEGEFLGKVLARMATGALAELSINWWTRSNEGEHRLWYEMAHACGTGGEAYHMDGRGTFVRLHDASDAEAIERYGTEALEGFVEVTCGDWRGHERCIEEWVKGLRGEDARVLTDGRTCRGTVEVAEAAYRAEREGRTVALPIEPRPWGE